MKKRTVIVTGASRGVGAVIAKLLARLGWNVVILAKYAIVPHPKLDTERTVAQEIADSGGSVLALQVDVRFEDQVRGAIAYAAAIFGGIDALINNASALPFDGSEKQLQLVHRVIVDGTRACTEACLPYLLKSENPHVLNIAPPIPMEVHWMEKYDAYARAKRTISKYTDVMGELYPSISFNAIWPKYMLFTAATVFGVFKSEEKARKHTRSPEIIADAIALVLESHGSGTFFTDESALKALDEINDFSSYLLPGSKAEDLMPDVFLPKVLFE